MSKTTRYPKNLMPFVQHGVRISEVDGDQAIGTCPFCGKQKHFGVGVEKQLWDCKKCRRNGNLRQFLDLRMRTYREAMVGDPLVKLARNRKIAKSSLERWGVGYDTKTGMYMIPLYERGKLVGIQRYSMEANDSLSTTTCKGGVFMIVGDPDLHQRIAICEGQWDTYAWDEALRAVNRKEAVIGIAGASRVPKMLADMLVDKDVVLAFDHDKAGVDADVRARKILGSNPRSLKSIQWSKDKPDRYDVRDLWIEVDRDPKQFFDFVSEHLVTKSPIAHNTPDTDQSDEDEPPTVDPTEPPQPTGRGCMRKEVIDGYRKWLYIPDTDIIDVVFGTAFANRLYGDPLWLFLVGPPGSLKTEMIQSLGESPLVSLETDITRQSLVSGMQTLAGNDPSLIPAWNKRVVLISDFTTILSMNQVEREAIFGILRSAYDGRYEKKFGNGVKRVYRSKFGILAGVTPVIENFSATHHVVGERFVKFYLRSTGHVRHGMEAIMQCVENMTRETDMREELRTLASKCLDRPIDPGKPPKVHDEVKRCLYGLAQWAAAMRGVVNRDRYTQDVLHRPVTEFGTRLVKQLTKLAMGVAIFRRKKTVGFDEFRIAARVARDTAPDRVEQIVHRLYLHRDEGWHGVDDIARMTRMPKNTTDKILQDMDMLRLVKSRKVKGTVGRQYRLSGVLIDVMQPLNLYTREVQWSRVRQVEDLPKKVVKRKRKGK